MPAWRNAGPLALGLALALQAVDGRAEAPGCGPGARALTAELAAQRLVFFGELHGSTEAPRFVGDYVCGLLRRVQPVVVALELPLSEQAALDRYLDSTGEVDDRAALLEGAHWRSERPDGRSSQAMLDLIEALRRLRALGAQIRILAFDGGAPESEPDQAMAEHLRRAWLSSSAHFVVLTGNVHARKRSGLGGDPGFRPLALRLGELGGLALNLAHGGGQIWACRGRDWCGALAVPASSASASSRSPGIELGRMPPSSGYDGDFFVGLLSASEPAAQDPSDQGK